MLRLSVYLRLVSTILKIRFGLIELVIYHPRFLFDCKGESPDSGCGQNSSERIRSLVISKAKEEKMTEPGSEVHCATINFFLAACFDKSVDANLKYGYPSHFCLAITNRLYGFLTSLAVSTKTSNNFRTATSLV